MRVAGKWRFELWGAVTKVESVVEVKVEAEVEASGTLANGAVGRALFRAVAWRVRELGAVFGRLVLVSSTEWAAAFVSARPG